MAIFTWQATQMVCINGVYQAAAAAAVASNKRGSLHSFPKGPILFNSFELADGKVTNVCFN